MILSQRWNDISPLLRTIKNEPVAVGHWVGLKDLSRLHNEWLRDFLFGHDDTTLLAHRGSYKTSTISLYLALHTIIRPNESVIYFRKTDGDVAEVARQTANILSTGAFRVMVGQIYQRDLKLLKATDSEINTNLHTAIQGASQIVGLGINASITGKHGDVVITDDIVNIKDRASRAERERTKTQYMELQNIRNRGGRMINCGTPWHKDDAISMMRNVKRYDCYSTGLMNDSQIDELRHSMSDSLFAANYELRHIADADRMFADAQYENDISLLHDGICHVDASYGGADFTAFTAIKRQGEAIYAVGKIWHKHVDDCLNDIAGLMQLYRLAPILCETNGDKGYLAKELKARGIPCRTYSERMNKYLKISTYLRSEWDRIKWLSTTDTDYMDQVLEYSENAEHDDAPDSIASLLRETQNATHHNSLKGLRL